MVCVVERAQDIVVVERTREFRGRYHVLGGAISPIEGIGPERLRFSELVARVRAEGIKEAIVATNPTVEGDTTALYLAKVLKPEGVRVTRLASGLPVGGRPRLRRRAHPGAGPGGPPGDVAGRSQRGRLRRRRSTGGGGAPAEPAP